MASCDMRLDAWDGPTIQVKSSQVKSLKGIPTVGSLKSEVAILTSKSVSQLFRANYLRGGGGM